MEWISVEKDLPEYEKPVFLKDTKKVYIGFRESTNRKGQNYWLLEKPIFDRGIEKITHWAKLEMPKK